MELSERKLYDKSAPNRSTKIVGGSSSGVLNWNNVRFDWSYPMYKNQTANFWRAEEVNMTGDIKQWAQLTEDERSTFKFVIGLLSFLDSVQTDYSGRVANYLTDSSLVANIQVLSFFEVIHNQSYSYVLASLVPESEQMEIFEYWKNDPILIERNEFIADGYQRFIDNPTPQTFFEAIVFDIILEGIFFFAGFAFFFNLARNQKMLGTNQMISYITRDEQIHVGLFAKIFRALMDDYPELDTPENKQFINDTLTRAVELEIKWAEKIIGDKFDGITMNEFSEYIKFIANKRCTEMGVDRVFPRDNRNPFPWIKYFEDANAGKTDFFESKSRQYAKTSDDFDDL